MSKPNQYAVYRGDKLLVTGGAVKCASFLNIKLNTLYSYTCKSRHNRKHAKTLAFIIKEEE